MRILGLDQSFKKSGIVVMENNNPTLLHAEKFSTENSTDYLLRAYQVAQYVSSIVIDYNVHSVYIEGLAFGARGDMTRNLAGLQYMVMAAVRFDANTHITIVPPPTLKKFATGSGKAQKKDMIEVLPPLILNYFLDTLGVKKTTGLDDMADAYHLAQYGLTKNTNTNTNTDD